MIRFCLSLLVCSLFVACDGRVSSLSPTEPQVDPSGSSVLLSAEQAGADGRDAIELTVRVVDPHGNPISGRAVELAASGSGNLWLTPPNPTDDQGLSTARLASTVAEEKSITVRVDGESAATELNQHVTVTFVPGDAAQLVFEVPPGSVQVDSILAPAVRVVVRDAEGNPVLAPTEITLALESNPRGATLSGTTTHTTDSGVATFDDLSVEVPASQLMLVATAPGIPSTLSTPFDVLEKPGQRLVFRTQPDPNAVAGSVLQPAVEVQLEDADGRVVENTPTTVSLALMPKSGTVPLHGPKAVETVNGIARFVGLHVDLAAQDYRLVATAPSLQGTTSDPFDVRAGDPALSRSSFNITPLNVTADGTSTATLTVMLKDLFGNSTPGQQIDVSVNGTDNIFWPDDGGLTDQDGHYSTTIASTVAGPRTLIAASGTVVMMRSVTFVPGAPSADTSTLIAANPTAIADGNDSITLTLTVKDAQGNVVPNVNASLASSCGQDVLSQASQTTDANGQLTATIATTIAEPKTITATIGALSVSTSVTFLPGAPAQATSSFLAMPDSIPADDTTTSQLQLTVRDAFGNLVPNAPVTFASTGSGNTLEPDTPTTDAQGQATTSFRSSVAEAKTISASFGNVTLTAPITVTAVTPPSTP